MNLNEAIETLKDAGYLVENSESDSYVSTAVKQFKQRQPKLANMFTFEELIEIFKSCDDLEDYVGHIPSIYFVDAMLADGATLFFNCKEKAGI